jgi:hypothetical protein
MGAFTKSVRYRKRSFPAGAIGEAVRKLSQDLMLDSASFSVEKTLEDGTKFRKTKAEYADIEHICEFSQSSLSVVFTKAELKLEFGVRDADSKLAVYATSDALQLVIECHRILQESLQLESWVDSSGEALSGPSRIELIEQRVSALEGQFRPPMVKPRCFFSFRFTDEVELVALRVERFLTLLGIEVITGQSYEPRQVTEKVISRLREPLDFVVLLVSQGGESMWTRDEIAAALHKGIAVVPLVEKGSIFNKGLFGDVEYIEFHQGHIGDAFLKLLQAVRFVGEQRAALEVAAAPSDEKSSARAS